ncbi:MAG: hypothetical protein EPO30_08600 [Lysobacteraceae bacterium]|nr:MAG: hypothetical protein EPO30_08600 [Xanthomonadaceae bacterium]
MKAIMSAGLATAALVLPAMAFAAQPEPAGTMQMADARFAPYCLRDTGSVIVAMQNRRAERHARATGTKPKLRCTATGVALKVNADGVPVPDQPGLRNR